jgi:hypothetical protein
MYNLDNFASEVNPPSPQEFALRVRRIQQERVLVAGESREYPHSDERITRWLGRSRQS